MNSAQVYCNDGVLKLGVWVLVCCESREGMVAVTEVYNLSTYILRRKSHNPNKKMFADCTVKCLSFGS